MSLMTLPVLSENTDVTQVQANRAPLTYLPMEWIDISLANSAYRCPRKALLSRGYGLRRPGIPTAMDYGTAVHKALPELLVEDDPTKATASAMKQFMSVWTSEHEAQGDDKRNYNRAYATFSMFHELHRGRNSIYTLVKPPESPSVLQTKNHVNDYEIPFGMDIGLPIPFVGRIDALVRHRDTGDLWALEWKTTAQGGNWFLGNFDLAPQPIGYCHALRSMGLDVKGTIVEYVLSAKVKAEANCKPIFIQPHMCVAFEEWVRYAGNMLLECERRNNFPQWFSGCAPYAMFGQPGFQCDYVKLCSVPEWQGLSDLYNVKRWNPFEVKELEV